MATKAQKQALRFAYDLLRGMYKDESLPYVHPVIPIDARTGIIRIEAPWMEPDCDPERLYLNEEVFTSLVMRGFFECRQFSTEESWLYRLSREGCLSLGWDWPTHQPFRITFHEQSRQFLVSMTRPYFDPHAHLNGHHHKRVTYDPHRFRRSAEWRKR